MAAGRGGERERIAVLWAVVLAFAVSAAFDWFWELPGLGAVFFLAAGALLSVRAASSSRPKTRSWGFRIRGRRYWLIALGLVAAWVSAAALVAPLLVDREITASQALPPRASWRRRDNHAENARSIEPWAASPYVQLGLLDELRGDYGAATRALHRCDRARGPQLAALLPARQGRAPARRPRGRQGRPGQGAGAQPAGIAARERRGAGVKQEAKTGGRKARRLPGPHCEPAAGRGGLRRPRAAAEPASRSPGAAGVRTARPRPSPPGPQPRRTALALGLGRRGAEGARRRGAVLRRLLALGDWSALIAALCAATAATATIDVATLFWALLASPIWILVFKLHGLYDNDHRRIRHSTLDVTSMTAPTTSGWSICRVGLSPTEKRRLVTAHTPCSRPRHGKPTFGRYRRLPIYRSQPTIRLAGRRAVTAIAGS